MKNIKYVLIKNETIRRVEKMGYEVVIPEKIKDKITYADKQVSENNYKSCKVIDIIDSEMLEEEIINLRRMGSRAK